MALVYMHYIHMRQGVTSFFFASQVDHLKDKVLEKLEQVLGDMNLESAEIAQSKDDSDESSKEEIIPELSPKNSERVSERDRSHLLSKI